MFHTLCYSCSLSLLQHAQGGDWNVWLQVGTETDPTEKQSSGAASVQPWMAWAMEQPETQQIHHLLEDSNSDNGFVSTTVPLNKVPRTSLKEFKQDKKKTQLQVL